MFKNNMDLSFFFYNFRTIFLLDLVKVKNDQTKNFPKWFQGSEYFIKLN